MIQINLLPKELRRAEPTPWPKLLALLISLIVILSVGLLWFYVRFNQLPVVLEEEARLKAQLDTEQKRAEEFDELKDKIESHKKHEETILDIRQGRWLWAKKLDQIIDFIPPYIQITSFRITEGKSSTKGGASGPQFAMDCICAGSDERKIAKFRRMIMSSPFWEDVMDMPEWPYSVEQAKDGSAIMRFRAVLDMKPKVAEKKKPPARPKPAREGPAAPAEEGEG